MKECQATRKICHEMIERGCLVYVAAGSKYATPGWPDRFVILPTGETFWLEFKTDDTRSKLSVLQRRNMQEINKRHKCAYVVRLGANQVEEVDSSASLAFDGTGLGLIRVLREIKRVEHVEKSALD